MALTDEELLLQMNILATKTDSTTHPNMVYKTVSTLNKGLNPDVSTGQNTKIVNALNMLAATAASAETNVVNFAQKVNDILLDTGNLTNQAIWETVQGLMEQPTIIEGIRHILEGKQVDRILGISADDIGKILSVAQDDEGNLVIQAIDASISGGSDGGSISEIDASKVKYENETHPNLTNVSDALDYLFVNGNGGSVVESIDWGDIVNKPAIANGLSLTETTLALQSEEGEISSVPLMNNEDVDAIFESLE